MTITYRKLLPVHAKQYRELRLESLKLYPDFFGSSFEEQSKLPELRLERSIKQQDANTFAIGAFAEDSLIDISGLIGICGFVAHNDYGLDQTGTLIQMYVKEAFGGQKIGLGLTKAILSGAFTLANINHIILGVHPHNSKAIRVYEQAGFQVYAYDAHPPATTGHHVQLMIFHEQQSG
jgi:RimJ/RimL family protein N-acetyltransferase